MLLSAFGHKTQKYCAVALETQRPPNAVNFEEFESMVILKPGQVYNSKTVLRFDVK
jgi:galactose mutarotase-like enzyme